MKNKIHIFERRVRESINERKLQLCTQLKQPLKETLEKNLGSWQSTAQFIKP